MRPQPAAPPVCDYEGSTYREDFWEGADRRYEDLAERRALAKLLPPTGGCLLELGAGFGRLADLYRGYTEVYLLDWSRSLLHEARQRLQGEDRYRYMVCNLHRTPFPDGTFDVVIMVRVMHHVARPDEALGEVRRLLAPGGALILEAANKRHLKAILRHGLLGRGHDPWDPRPVEANPGHFNFHPASLEASLRQAGFRVERRLSVSLFRSPLLKRWLAPERLAAVEDRLQGLTAPLTPGPSLFLRAGATGPHPQGAAAPPGGPRAAWRCPACGAALVSASLEPEPSGGRGASRPPGHHDAGPAWRCSDCQRGWVTRQGIHDFKTPV